MKWLYPCKVAIANVKGGPLAPDICGFVIFRDVRGGVIVYLNINGLPEYSPGDDNNPPVGPHGFHMHEKGNCTIGIEADPFKDAGGHWNPANQPHGNHAGDFPVLFSNDGSAIMSFFTDKFKVRDVIGLSLIIHENPDDFQSQPSGNAGKRLACGIIKCYDYYYPWYYNV